MSQSARVPMIHIYLYIYRYISEKNSFIYTGFSVTVVNECNEWNLMLFAKWRVQLRLTLHDRCCRLGKYNPAHCRKKGKGEEVENTDRTIWASACFLQEHRLGLVSDSLPWQTGHGGFSKVYLQSCNLPPEEPCGIVSVQTCLQLNPWSLDVQQVKGRDQSEKRFSGAVTNLDALHDVMLMLHCVTDRAEGKEAFTEHMNRLHEFNRGKLRSSFKSREYFRGACGNGKLHWLDPVCLVFGEASAPPVVRRNTQRRFASFDEQYEPFPFLVVFFFHHFLVGFDLTDASIAGWKGYDARRWFATVSF